MEISIRETLKNVIGDKEDRSKIFVFVTLDSCIKTYIVFRYANLRGVEIRLKKKNVKKKVGIKFFGNISSRPASYG